MPLQVREQHLDLLASGASGVESVGVGQSAGGFTGFLIDETSDRSNGAVGAARFERTPPASAGQGLVALYAGGLGYTAQGLTCSPERSSI